MPSLAILVRSNKYLDQLIEFVNAAKSEGVEMKIFFTHKGVLLTQEPRFTELTGLADLSLCNVGYESNNLKGKPAPGVPDNGFATQARNGMMIEDCDRYVVF
jgi:hypothetical protein